MVDDGLSESADRGAGGARDESAAPAATGSSAPIAAGNSAPAAVAASTSPTAPAGSIDDSFFATSVDLLCVAGTNGFAKRLNPAWERALGRPLAELMAAPFLEFVHPEDVARTLAALKLARAGAGTGDRDFENRYRHKDGSYVWFAWRFAPAPDGVLYGVARDVTKRKRADESLRRERSFIRQVLDASPNLISVRDAEGRFVLANRALGTLFGLTPESILNKRHVDILQNPEEARIFAAADLRVLRSRQVLEVEEPMTLASGEQRVFSTLKAPMVRPNGEVQVLAISTDVTDRKKGEGELIRAREQAVEASRAKSQFLANMSHEIRTPMNGILGMTALALETELTQEQRDYLEAVETSGKNLLQIVNDILDLSKIEAQKLDLEAVPFELGRSIEETLRALAPRVQEKGLELIFQVSPLLPWSVIGDPVRFRQVVTNLVGNAIKFTERGEIVVTAEPDADSPPEAALVRVSVEDTGGGIRRDRLSKIFDAFTQEDGSTTRRFGGTGLGLTISRELVRRMGGRIWVESTPGLGSTFRFTVRLEPADPVPGESKPDLRGLRALVVDDNARNLSILCAALKSWNAEVEGVGSAGEALGILQKRSEEGGLPRILVVDAVMPGSDGLAFCQIVEAEPILSSIPRILLLAPGQRIPRNEIESAGIARTLHKPIAEAQLLEAIRSAITLWAARKDTASSAALVALIARTSPGAKPPPPPEPPTPAPILAARTKAGELPLALLAEDNDINALLARKMLERLGWRCERVANGVQAVEKVERGHYDAILMDVQMPAMDGYEATRRVRDRETAEGLSHVPIIALTANAMKGDEVRCLEAGMDLYLAKPLTMDGLRLVLDQARGLNKR